MKRLFMLLMSVLAMTAASLSAKAQEITIYLMPGWNWISYTNAVSMDIDEALGDFVPMEGDIVKSKYAQATCRSGSWRGTLHQFTPGLGYHYYSNRGEPVSFVFANPNLQPQVTVTTSEPLLITAVSAMGGGEVTTNDGTYIITKGLCWATHENPTTNDDFYQEAESGVGTFSISMTELNIATTYYVRAYAVTPNGTVYGNEKVFTTRDGIPTVTTADVTDILGDGATCGGDVTDNCGLSIIARGVCWSTSSNPTILESHTNDSTGMGSFISTITGLSVSTTYYVRAYATTIAGTAYGDVKTFTTCNGIPNVTTLEVTRVLLYTAACGGNVTEDGGLSIIARGVCWSTSPNPTVADPHTTNGTGTGVFSSWISGLSMNTTYYVRAYATNNIVTVYGNQLSFTTQNSSVGQYVDLGLPSGLLWATCNVGAETPEGAGEQFDYSLPTTYWGEWGENRRVPTKGEWQELCQNTTHTWITQNGTDGMLFTASNGNSLFLPIGGWIGEMPPEEEIEEGYYWSSSLDTSRPYYVWYFHFNMGGGYDMNSVTTELGFRYFSVRLVSDHGYVDLGLPSGTLWATCNVGAEYPEDYGDYFAWGETQPKNVYNWSTYQYCNGSYNTLTKYCTNSSYGYNGFTDNLTLLLPEDDAATANWGADWRMPTEGEWQELYDNTTTTWTTQDGVFGRLFTASNGNSIFLPAAGYRSGSSLNDGTVDYWSNTLYQSTQSRAWEFYSVSDNSYMDDARRYLGLSVRAVRSASHIPTYTINVSSNSSIGGSITGGGTYQEGQTCTVTATANAGYAFTNWTEEGEVVSTEASYSFTVTGNRSLVANYAISSGNDHGYVDLGLPSGLLWATCNVGADSPEDYGDYFAWGETQPKDTYNWSTYQYCNGSSSTLTKYCNNSSYGYNGFTDDLTTLLPEDDAAMANWGSGWRMPTAAEWYELYNNTAQTWTTQNGVNGRLFTAANGNSLFLPAAGYRWGGEFYDAGSGGYYWSSSLYAVTPNFARDLYFDSGGTGVYDYYGRLGGFSVRPVLEN
jgi:hypothetical protein